MLSWLDTLLTVLKACSICSVNIYTLLIQHFSPHILSVSHRLNPGRPRVRSRPPTNSLSSIQSHSVCHCAVTQIPADSGARFGQLRQICGICFSVIFGQNSTWTDETGSNLYFEMISTNLLFSSFSKKHTIISSGHTRWPMWGSHPSLYINKLN